MGKYEQTNTIYRDGNNALIAPSKKQKLQHTDREFLETIREQHSLSKASQLATQLEIDLCREEPL